jgi:Putative DNA-binding domain
MDERKRYEEADLLRMTGDGDGEFRRREFKGGRLVDSYDDRARDTLTKAVSSFANSNGGIVVIGIKEEKPRHPGGGAKREFRLEPVTDPARDRDWLDRVLGNIDPRIPGLDIQSVQAKSGGHYFIVEVPPGETAHQATDKIYYRRYNTEAVPMAGFEIRDVMNRMKHPKVTAELRVSPLIRSMIESGFELEVRIRNEGAILARHYLVVVNLPAIPSIGIMAEKNLRCSGEGKDPLFPQSESIKKISFHGSSMKPLTADDLDDSQLVELTVFADSMQPWHRQLRLRDCYRNWC